MSDDEEYLSVSAVSRILGVTRQRVAKMIDVGDLPAVYPWPRAVRIPRSAVEAWQQGYRQPSITRTSTRAWVCEQAGVDSPEKLTLRTIRKYCRVFIEERRPDWAVERQRDWAENMAALLGARR